MDSALAGSEVDLFNSVHLHIYLANIGFDDLHTTVWFIAIDTYLL